jgi:hypothetical protein
MWVETNVVPTDLRARELYTFQEDCERLAALETFDPAAFRGDATVPQQVCNFILALALIHNDCKDVMYSMVLLEHSKPASPPDRTRDWGAFFGMRNHIFRVMVGILHELFGLIQQSQDVLEHPYVAHLVRQLPPKAREAWQTVVDVGLGATPKSDFGKTLLLVRNKVAFHYDPKAIYQGYEHHFFGPRKSDDRAFISRGLSVQESRFYFADAAAEDYLNVVTAEQYLEKVYAAIAEFLRPLNHSLMELVDRFIQRRGFAYRATD